LGQPGLNVVDGLEVQHGVDELFELSKLDAR